MHLPLPTLTVWKAAVIHDVIDDNQLDVLAMSKTWIPSDASDACPLRYQVLHRYCGTSVDQRAEGVPLVHRDITKAQ